MRRVGLIGLCCIVACFSETEPQTTSDASGTASPEDPTTGTATTGFDSDDSTSSGPDEGLTSSSSGFAFDSSSTGVTEEVCGDRLTFLFDPASTKAGLSDLTFPVWLDEDHVDYANIDIPNVSVLDAQEHRIPHRIDTWREGGDSVLWVRAPQIDGRYDRIFVCFGAPQPARPDVWLPEVVGVWNFGDPEKTGAIPDESLYAHTATILSSSKANPSPRTSPLGEALAFTQPGDFAEVANSAELTPPQSMTIEAVVRKTNAESDWQTVVQKSAGYNLRVTDGFGEAGTEVFFSEQSSISTRLPEITGDEYVYLAAIYDQAEGQLRFCINGDACATTQAPTTALFGNETPLQIGRGDVEIDHFRITAAARSPQWIEAAARGFAGTLLLPFSG